jgi:epoxyqueuosine reductase
LKDFIKKRAKTLGFDAVGISRVSSITIDHLQLWLKRGYQGQMSYLERGLEKRLDPAKLFPSARSVISVGLNYYHGLELPYGQPDQGVVSRYARGTDYHFVLEKKLLRLLSDLQELEPVAKGKVYVDTGPVMEKYWAAQSGLGWVGKHTNLLSRENGSWFFIGEVLLSLELPPDRPAEDFCGSCERCIQACPTQAIVEPYVLDARRCISYLTIEHRGDLREDLRKRMGNLIFGCDICQDVCPWNRKAPNSDVEEFREPGGDYSLRVLAGIGPERFRDRFRRSPMKRAKWQGLLRNVAVAMGNSGLVEVIPELLRLLDCEEAAVRRHAAWALVQLGTEKARLALAARLRAEGDPDTVRTMRRLLALTGC